MGRRESGAALRGWLVSAPSRKVWRRCCLLQCWAAFPYEVPFKVEHFAGAWDYSDATWQGGGAPGVFATFDEHGAQAYRGGSTPGYELITLETSP